MRRNKKIYEDDDGRTIADMSDVSAPNLFVPKAVERPQKAPQSREKAPVRPWEDTGYSRKERFLLIMGALKATLLIASAFIVGLGAFVLLIYFLA